MKNMGKPNEKHEVRVPQTVKPIVPQGNNMIRATGSGKNMIGKNGQRKAS